MTAAVDASARRGEATVVSRGHGFLEAPRWHEGELYASDFFDRVVLRWDRDGRPHRVCEVPGEPSGLGWTADGDLLIVSMADRRLVRFDAEDGLIEVADLSSRAPWHCNDMVVDRAGRAYVGNLGWDDEKDPWIRKTILMCVAPDGAVTVAAGSLVNPNGMAITPDGRTLLVNETFAARVTAFDIDADGSLARRRIWAAFSDVEFESVPQALASGALLPDGIALDREGAVWLGDCRGRGAVRVAEGGERLDFVSTGDHAAFAVALGGADRAVLFMCTAPPYEVGGLKRVHEGAMCSHPVVVPGAGRP